MKNRIAEALIVFALLSGSLACTSGEKEPKTPIETFKTYTKAIKNKDVTTMKLLLSRDTMKMNETEAQMRGVPVDEVVKNETLFSENQKTVKLRNEKIEGDKATLEVENTFGTWETVPFIKEEGVWKIDKKGYAQRLMDEVNQGSRELDNLINESRQTPQP
jgi:hypothetical protein